MKKNTIHKLILGCFFLVGIFVFWDFLLFSRLQIQKNHDYLEKALSLSKKMVDSESEEFAFVDAVAEDVVSPNVKMLSETYETEEKVFDFTVTADESLKTGNYDHYSVAGSDGEYKVLLLNISIGKNKYKLTFEDLSGNTTYKDVEVFRKSPYILGASTDVKIWINGDDLLAVVAKEFSLPSDYYPKDLVAISDFGVIGLGKGMVIRKVAAADLKKMNEAAKSKGFDLVVLSSYRSYETQISTYTYWVNAVGKEEAGKRSAEPGHSEHQLGTTLDFTCAEVAQSGENDFGKTGAGKWLANNSYKFGFILSYPLGSEEVTGYKHEAWHFRYIGVENAVEVHKSGKILIEYLREAKL
ncbi:MAG: M15 family metallopeptidase [Patescibacteria group bacterium]|nr:M15 family metallopeptidase [Patescibacteria group bacterium]